MQADPGKRELIVSKVWLQAAIVVFLFGFFVLGLLAYRTYTSDPPIPERVVDPAGRVIFTADDIRDGQRVFLRNGLMEYGSIFGHGAYLGPDFTNDYLHRAALSVRGQYREAGSDRAQVRTISDFQANRYDGETKDLTYTAAQARAFADLRRHYADFFGEPTTKFGLKPEAITDPAKIDDLTAFFSWSAWAAAARRPGHNYSYTNNWPPEKLVETRAPSRNRDRLSECTARPVDGRRRRSRWPACRSP